MPFKQKHANIENHKELIELIITKRNKDGNGWPDIYKWLFNDLKYADSTVYLYIKEAKAEIVKRSFIVIGKDLEEEIERMQRLYDLNMFEGDKKEARLCLIEINKLKGLYLERKELSGNMTFVAKFGDLGGPVKFDNNDSDGQTNDTQFDFD